MIRKMAKAYTDKQIRDKDPFVKVGTGWWSNGFLALFEDTPASLADEGKEVPESQDLKVWEWTQAESCQVWPVVLRSGDGTREIEIDHETRAYAASGCAIVQFVGDDTEIWADAHYISSILKRDKTVEWYVNTEGQIVARSLTSRSSVPPGTRGYDTRYGDTIALLMPLKPQEGNSFTPDWQIANHDLNAPKSLALARKVDALLPRGKKGADWQAVTVNGRAIEAKRQVNPGLTWKEGKVGRAHSTGLSNGVSLLPQLVNKRTRKQTVICIRQGGRWAEIDLYDGHTRLGKVGQ